MGIAIISEFDLSKKKPLDSRLTVADSTARLALFFPFKGLRVKDLDTGKLFEYTGDETTNLAGDWTRIATPFTGTGAPSNSLGVIDDTYLALDTKSFYKKTGTSTWTLQFTLQGSQIYTSAAPPNNADGNNGDINIEDNGDVYRKESGAWALKFNIVGPAGASGDKYATTSSTSINLGTAADPITLTIGTGLAYTPGQEIIIVSAANIANNIASTVSSYNSGTGVLIVTSSTINGTGTHTDWVVNLSGAPGKQGKAFIHTEADITLTAAKITAVEGGSWTPEAPWSASVLNDTRSASELIATAGIVGPMIGHSIAFNGTSWIDNGVWRGSKGDKGDKGDTGANSTVPGPPGPSGKLWQFLYTGAGTVVYNANDFTTGHNEVIVQVNSSNSGILNLTLPQLSSSKTFKFTIVNIGNLEVRIRGWQDNSLFKITGVSVGVQGDFISYIGAKIIEIVPASLAFYIVANEQLQDEPKGGTSNSIISQTGLTTTELTNTSISGLFGKIYPIISMTIAGPFSFPAVSPNTFKPFVTFTFGARSDSSQADTIEVTIQRSNSGVSTDFTDVKTVFYTLEGNCPLKYITISAVDRGDIFINETVYYRLQIRVTTGTKSIVTQNIDYEIATILYPS